MCIRDRYSIVLFKVLNLLLIGEVQVRCCYFSSHPETEVVECNVKAGGVIPSRTSYIAGFRGGDCRPGALRRRPGSSVFATLQRPQDFSTRILWRRLGSNIPLPVGVRRSRGFLCCHSRRLWWLCSVKAGVVISFRTSYITGFRGGDCRPGPLRSCLLYTSRCV